MHECPDCGEVCDCFGEDTWYSWPYNMDCEHQCEAEREYDDDDFDGQEWPA